eukprot:14872129-Ditylum_brightwellii.AAC.1
MHTTPDKILSDHSPQLLCDMHHEDHYHYAKGIIGKCTQYQLEFTTQDVINNALNRWKNMSTGGNHVSTIFPTQRHCSDVYDTRHVYDLYSSKRDQCCNITSSCSLAHYEWTKKCILNLCFNEMLQSILLHALKKVMHAATTYLIHCQKRQQLTSEVIQSIFTSSLELIQKSSHS